MHIYTHKARGARAVASFDPGPRRQPSLSGPRTRVLHNCATAKPQKAISVVKFFN